MLKTLQFYVSRELLKTFLLTAVGLTLTFSLTGGVLNMIQAEVLTTVQMLHLLAFVLPVATTLTLPVSALFSCAMVYGRLAADNEFDACKASGVNIHRLLAPAMGLSILTAVTTFGLANYVIPEFIERMEALVRRDIQKVVVQALNTQGYIKQGPYIVSAGYAPRTEQTDDLKTVHINGAAVMQVENDNLAMCGTADYVRVDFTTAQTGDPVVRASLYGIRAFDFQHSRAFASSRQSSDPMVLPTRMEQKTKWLDLGELLSYRANPIELLAVQSQLGKLRLQVRDALFYRDVQQQLTTGDRVLLLKDRDGEDKYEIRAEAVNLDRVDFRPELARVRVKAVMEGHTRTYTADRCTIRVGRGLGPLSDIVHLRLAGRVSFSDSQQPGRGAVPANDTDLDEVPLPMDIYEAEKRLSDRELLGVEPDEVREAAFSGRLDSAGPPPLGLGLRVEDTRASTLREMAKSLLEISGVIHSRIAFSASVLVMLVLAAALAIIYRGGQLLTAFVISFIPALLVVVLNIAGRQLSENPGTHLIGVSMMWSGIALVAVADVVVLGRFLRR